MYGLIQGTGPLAGFNAAPIDAAKLHEYLAACTERRIQYGLGHKATPGHLTDYPPRYLSIDCSGWVRCAIAYSTAGAATGTLVLPDGSVNQHDWCSSAGLKPTEYANCGLSDGHVRIAFLTPDDTSEGIGHVWLVQDGRTLESHGGTGPASRSWDTPILMHSHAAYVLC